MEDPSLLNSVKHGFGLWTRQTDRVSLLHSMERNQLLEQLLSQCDLNGMLTTFAYRVAKIVRIHSLCLEFNQPHVLIHPPSSVAPKLCNYAFELHDQHGELLGQLHYQLQHSLSDNQRRLLLMYHQQLCLLLPLYLRVEKLEALVRLDHLTGLGNRSCFDEAISRAIEQHSREPSGLILVLLDLDRFKQINDTWGHPTGDLVLSRFAELLRECIRNTDQAFRLGGDEFALLLQPAEPDAWRTVWGRLQHLLMTDKELRPFSVRCSIGIASWQSGIDVSSLYKAADSHLYARKKAFRTNTNEQL